MDSSTSSKAKGSTTIPWAEVKKHGNAGDCWVIVDGKVYDLSQFEHSGGLAVILKYAGADATEAFSEVHSPGILNQLSPKQLQGAIDITTMTPTPPSTSQTVAKTNAEKGAAQPYTKPPLESILSLHDFEAVAWKTYAAKTMAFYSSAATDLVAHQANLQCHRQLLLRPRVLRNVREVKTRRTILGCESSAPFFFSPAAMAKLAHPDGELAVARACGEQGIIQTISTNASYPLDEIVSAGRPNQPFFLQLYVNSDRAQTASLLRSAKSLNIKAIFLTVDAPVPGKREADERILVSSSTSPSSPPPTVSAISGAVAKNDKKGGGLGRVMGKYIDATLSWSGLAWIKSCTDNAIPLVLKGIQTAADALLAAQSGVVDGVLLSNHGGRSLDTTQPAMATLLELHKTCPEVFDKVEVYVDGGFTRGTDVLKAISLGAVAVGIGRPWLYAVGYGQEGVEHLCEILKDELETTMKMCGITDVDQAHPGLVNTAALEPLVRNTEEHPWIQWRPKARI